MTSELFYYILNATNDRTVALDAVYFGISKYQILHVEKDRSVAKNFLTAIKINNRKILKK